MTPKFVKYSIVSYLNSLTATFSMIFSVIAYYKNSSKTEQLQKNLNRITGTFQHCVGG